MKTDRWVSHVNNKGADPYGMGRWSYTTLRGKGKKTIVLVTAYRPCKDSFDGAGDKTVYMHQNKNTTTKGTPNPHRQFILDLKAWIEMLQEEGASIILCLDGNEDVSQTTATYHPLDYTEGSFISSKGHNGSLSTLVTTCSLVDSLSLHQPPFPSTYAYRPNRLDYIFVSQDIYHASI
jgi:hypothetical protein